MCNNDLKSVKTAFSKGTFVSEYYINNNSYYCCCCCCCFSICHFGNTKKRADRMNRPEFYPQKLAMKFEAPTHPNLKFCYLLPLHVNLKVNEVKCSDCKMTLKILQQERKNYDGFVKH